MYLLPGNPSSHAVEPYRDSGEARCAKSLHTAVPPFTAYTAQLQVQHHNQWQGAPHGVYVGVATLPSLARPSREPHSSESSAAAFRHSTHTAATPAIAA